MMKRILAVLAMGFIATAAQPGLGADIPTSDYQIAQGGPAGDRPYGWQMMTEQERRTYQERMRNARTAEERERIRAENHERMQQRARERGTALPDDARPRRGMGPGGGMMDDDMRGRGGSGRGR